ncbi:hypothetical protein FRB90_003236, partial [Tulasnella sp. 427]
MPSASITSSSPPSDTGSKGRRLAMSPLSNGSFSKASPPAAPQQSSNLVKKPSTRASATLSVRSVFGGARAAAAAKKDRDSDFTSGAETETKRPSGTSRFGFKRGSLSTKAEATKVPPLPSRSTPTPTSTNTTPTATNKGSLRTKPASPIFKKATKPPSPVAQTPLSVRTALSTTNYNDSPGPLSDPVINLAASTSNRILDLQASPSQDMTAPGDLTFASIAMSDGTPRKAATDDDAEEEGDVSALLPMVNFGAPTPAHPRILIRHVNDTRDDDDDDDDDDLDNDNDDDPTVLLQMETPSRSRVKGNPKNALNGLPPARQNLSYLSPQPPTPGSTGFFSRSRRPRVPSNNASASKNRSRRTSLVSTASASRRTSKIRPAGPMERGSVLSWEAVIERSKEFADADFEELGMISTIGLGGLGAMSPGFGTPMYQRLSFTSATTDRDRSVSSRRTSGAIRKSRTSKENEVVISANASEAGSTPGSARLQPPETPSPLGASTSSKKSPVGLKFTPLDPVPKFTRGRAAKEQNAADKLKKQLDSQTAQLNAVQRELENVIRDLEVRNATITSLEETRTQFLKERLAFEAAKQEWTAKEAAWMASQQAWVDDQQRNKEMNELKELLQMENSIKA